jgi:pimeloyl-ACP methyl ester carboxylesterase
MRVAQWAVLVTAGATLSACASVRPIETRPPVARLFKGDVGWFEVTTGLTLDAAGNPVLPAVTPEVLAENPSVKKLLLKTYAEQFAESQLDGRCGAAASAGVVFILVHGVGGDGLEWLPVVPTLAKAGPRAMYMYRWFFPRERGELLDALVSGVERIAACHPGSRLVLLAHSAGGVLASFAASRFRVPEGTALEVLTVASPLAGSGMRADFELDDDTRFLLQLGGVIRGYPAAAPRVRVTHLRTDWPADAAMKPSSKGYRPNDPAVRVEGAEVIDLPASLDHSTALLHAAEELASGRR